MIAAPVTAVPVTMYFHLDAYQDFPVNTQRPDPLYTDARSIGLFNPTTTCVPDGGGLGGQVSQSYHTFYGFSTPGYVEYDGADGPRIHPERGIAGDVEFAHGEPMRLIWYMETQATSNPGDHPLVDAINKSPWIVPNVVVTGTVRTGNEVSIGAVAYNAGQVLAEGSSAPMILRPDPANPSYHEGPGGVHVYEFAVDLEVRADRIPQAEGYNVRVDVRMDVPGCQEDKNAAVMLPLVRSHTSPDFRPRLEWGIENPIHIQKVLPRLNGTQAIIEATVSSPWGNYDVDEHAGGITARLLGTTPLALARTDLVQAHHEHDRHFEPVVATFVWDIPEDLEPAPYTIEVTAWNDQRTASTVATAVVDLASGSLVDSHGNRVLVGEAPGKPASGLGVSLVVVLLGAVVSRRRLSGP